MKMDILLLLICILLVSSVDSGRLNVVLEEKKVSGRDLHQVCNPVGLNEDILQVKNTNGSANRKLAWLGAIVQYTPWVEYYGCGRIRDIKNSVNKADLSMYECNQLCSQINHTYDYIGMQENTCYCLIKGQLIETLRRCKVKECNDFLCYNGRDPSLVVLYTLNSNFSGNDSKVGRCGVLNYTLNKTSVGSKRCSDTCHPVCYKNTTRTNKGHEQKLSWSESMRHCTESSHSSVKNLNSAINYLEHGSYWTTSVRAAKFFPVQVGTQGSPIFHCVAAWVSEDNTIEERVIELCEKSLPVLCLESTTRTELTNSNDVTIERATTPKHIENKEDEEHKSQMPWAIIAGITGGIGIIFIIVLVIVIIRKRSQIQIAKSVAVTNLNDHSTNASNEETLESDNGNIYNASKSEEKCVMLNDSNYDSMSAIRQDTEGVYDHTSSTQNAHRKNEDVDVYDHADPVIIKQSLQIENDGVYNQCELNINSVIAKAHVNGDSTTIYDHA